ncbi:MAG: hypothetical protein HY369_03835 [Candidatus Aenigmarchaeota archaeon]|nr:hypothetical protein [Candidatus Aenigmarchaeota archaeon]
MRVAAFLVVAVVALAGCTAAPAEPENSNPPEAPAAPPSLEDQYLSTAVTSGKSKNLADMLVTLERVGWYGSETPKLRADISVKNTGASADVFSFANASLSTDSWTYPLAGAYVDGAQVTEMLLEQFETREARLLYNFVPYTVTGPVLVTVGSAAAPGTGYPVLFSFSHDL